MVAQPATLPILAALRLLHHPFYKLLRHVPIHRGRQTPPTRRLGPLAALGEELVLRIVSIVLHLRGGGEVHPGPALVRREAAPHLPRDARDVAVVVLDLLRDLLLRDKVAAEHDERVARAGDVSRGLLLRVRLLLGRVLVLELRGEPGDGQRGGGHEGGGGKRGRWR